MTSPATFEIVRGRGVINLRGDSRNGPFVRAIEGALGQTLPVVPNTLSEGRCTIYWLGPDEYQIVCNSSETEALCTALNAALDGHAAAINDVSGGIVSIRLHGSDIPALLSKGTTLDLHPDVFGEGCCAQSGLAKATVLLGNPHGAGIYDLFVRRSFSDYLIKWLKHAFR